jgi:hypothetical protein
MPRVSVVKVAIQLLFTKTVLYRNISFFVPKYNVKSFKSFTT